MPLTDWSREQIVRLFNRGHNPAAIVRMLATDIPPVHVTTRGVMYQIEVNFLLKM